MIRPTISVIVPAYNAEGTLGECLAGLAASTRAPYEIIVVDDASTDRSREIANRANVRVIALDANLGAARAKNRGANVASGDILFFTDSDILVKPDALGILAERLTGANLTGVVGVLDGEIPFQDFASRFKNYWMNFTYARLAPEKTVGLFYTSAAAIRREVFAQLGGFDENYHGASLIEDSEFGQRLWQGGARVVIEPRVAVIHLKSYTVGQVLHTDYLRARALMLLRLRKWGQPFYTSVPLFYQLSVPLIYLALFTPLLFLLSTFLLDSPPFTRGLLSLIPLFGFYLANARWLAFLAHQRGFGFAIRAALFLPFDVFIVGLGMLRAVFDFTRGVRY